MAHVYQAFNAAQPTTAGPVKVTTTAAIKTLLQIATPATEDLRVIEWGISFDGTAPNTPVLCELIDTDVAATVTAHAASGVVKLNNPNDPASLVVLGTTATGFTATGEGTPGATSRLLDAQLVPPSQQYIKQFPLGREPVVPLSRFLRVRVTAGTAVNAICYVTWEE